MLLSNKKLTYCITTFIVLLALGFVFGPAPVMAHQLPTPADGAPQAEKDAVAAHNNDPHDPEESSSNHSADHALVDSITISGSGNAYLTTTNTLTATITFADGVAAIENDTDNDDDPADATAGDDNEARHGTLSDPATDLATANIVFEVGTRGTDGTYTYAVVSSGNIPQVLSIAKTTPEGSGDTGSGSVYTVVIGVPNTVPGNDGMYKISISADPTYISDDDKATFVMDTRNPTVTNVVTRAIGTNYQNINGEWESAFEITFDLLDPVYDPEGTTSPATDADLTNNFASGFNLTQTTLTFETDPANELSIVFSDVRLIGPNPVVVADQSNKYVVTATPVPNTTTTDKDAVSVEVTIKVKDMAGNEGSSTDPDPADTTDPPPNRDPLTVKLAARDGRDPGPGPGDQAAPTLTSITAPTAADETDGSLVFEIMFNEEIDPNTFTVADDLKLTNAMSPSLSSTDNQTFELTVMPMNKDFPVKVEFKEGAKVTDASSNNNESEDLSVEVGGVATSDTYTPEGLLGVEIEAPERAEIDGRLKFRFEFSVVPATSGAGMFTVSDITVTNAEPLVEANLQQSVSDSKVFTLTVTPKDPAMPVTVQLNADAVSNTDASLIAPLMSVTYIPDVTAPVVTITPPAAGATNPLTFTIDFDEELSEALEVADLAITGADASAATLTAVTTGLPTGVAARYTLAVTGTPGTAVTVNVMANAVMDDMDNYVVPLATAATFTIPVPGGDTTNPTLEITHSPADGVALGTSGNVTFTFTFTEDSGALGTGTSAFTLGDITFENGRAVDFTGSGLVYTLVVAPIDPNMPVTVSVASDAVQDGSDNDLAADVSESYQPIDETDPDVEITSAEMGTGANRRIVFTFTFSEALGSDSHAFMLADIDRTNSNVLLSGQPELVTGADAPDSPKVAYTLVVTPNPLDADPVIIVLRTLSVADMSGNTLKGDRVGTYKKPPPPDPETDKPVVTISGPSYIDSVGGATITIRASDSGGSGLAANAEIIQEEVTLEGGTIIAGSFKKGATASFRVIPNVAAITVKIGVKAGAVADSDGNTNVLQTDATKPYVNPRTFNVGPIFRVPAGNGITDPGYLVVTRSFGSTYQYLSDEPTLPTSPENEDPPIRAFNISVSRWGFMPDLERLFNTSSGNGGTLNIKAAATNKDSAGNALGTGGVRMTEVMWAIDEARRGAPDDREAWEQWVEIENPNAHAVYVIMYARTGRDSAINTSDGQIDRIGNAYNGSPGSARWTVPGNNGNSYTGIDFVSMWRRYVENNRGKGYQNGTASGAWSAASNIYLTRATQNPNDGALYNYKGTPGRLQSVTLPRPSTRAGVTQVPSSPFIINEVANRDSGNAEYEWIEIKNVTNDRQNLRNYLISMVTATDTDTVLLEIDNKDYWVDGGDVILLLASDPRYDDDHPIAVGYNVDVNENDQVDGLGLIVPGSNRKPPRQKVTTFKNGGLPDGGDYVLILRRPDNYEGHRANAHGGKGVAETGGNDVDKIVDIAGSHRGLSKSNYPGTTPAGLNNTTLWPLVNFNEDMRPHYGHGNLGHRRHNRLEVNRVRYRQHRITKAKNDHDGATPGNRAGTGVTHKDEGVGHYAFRDAVYTGLGYKRTARVTGYNNGTPGYDGNSVGNTGIVKTTADKVSVSISEIMLSTGPDADTQAYPQWIELYNSSPTDAVNLRNWKLRFEMLDENGDPMDSLMNLNFNSSRSVKTIQPQQTVLIVASRAQANSDARTGTDVFSENRVFNVQRDVGLGKFGANTRYMFFNPKAFNIAVLDKDNKVVDQIGNLDGDNRTSDTNTWDFPVGITQDNKRTSLIRIYDDGVARGHLDADGVYQVPSESDVMPIFGMGDGKRKNVGGIDAKYIWIPAVNADLQHKITIRSTWYGDEDDYGTPNNRKGMVLPVELSSFRPTLEDGVVTIRWTTESELDNAGFNIYRSEERDGEFKQVNSELIEGAGTTGERSTYSWVDQTAKPGVIYYYQIEDVSFAGERQPLAITKLKGLISANNKLTTTWSELKEASQ